MNKGFTLIELLVSMAIIGIIASMAVSQFIQFSYKAYDASAKSDVRNLYTAYVAKCDANTSVTTETCLNDSCETTFPGFQRSPKVYVNFRGSCATLAPNELYSYASTSPTGSCAITGNGYNYSALLGIYPHNLSSFSAC